ncbi:MAG: type II toxin-antitoxin system VapC family toxin [Opitutaceae bacterium]
MIVAVDSSVLLAIFKGETKAEAWFDLLARHRRRGRLIACEVVVAEVSARFPDEESFRDALENLGVEFVAIELPAALLAGRLFTAYRREGGPREHLVPDFLVGAHAALQAGSLAAVDRGYLRRYFDGLKLLAV